MRHLLAILFIALLNTTLYGEESALPRIKAGLQKVGLVVGEWKGTGEPMRGTLRERQEGFWIEQVDWQWKFEDDDAWLVLDIDKGKHYTAGELRYDPAKDTYRLTLTTIDKKNHVYTGELAEKKLMLDRVNPMTNTTERIGFHLLHNNRYLMNYEEKSASRSTFRALWRTGNTKKGVAFATGGIEPVCIVSGGLGTSKVMYKGKTYYVCCSGCRDAFNEEPEKYVREFEKKRK